MRYETRVVQDAFTERAAFAFDVPFEGVSVFESPRLPEVPKDYGIGLIVGPSGSGKSTLLREHFGAEETPAWSVDKAIVSHFDSPDDAINRLCAVGLNTIPSWLRPYHVLSNGEKFRADLARKLKDGAVIDEFTSVVDRNVAKAASVGLRRAVDKAQLKRITLATCHYDVVEWLQPDWVFDIATGVLTPRGSLPKRPEIVLEIRPATTALWPIFAPHHYLAANLNKTANCWIATWNDVLVGFAASLAFPHATIRNAYRGHRTVVLPDYQGLGIGMRLSDAIAQLHLDAGKRYFSRTAHPRMGAYRDASPLWKPTSTNHKQSGEPAIASGKNGKSWVVRRKAGFSHEYVGICKQRLS